MALTETTPMPLGFIAPDFSLLNVQTGEQNELKNLKGDQLTVVMFICNHCPYVVHIRAELIRIAHDYADRGVSFIAISANDPISYPDDSPQKMKELADSMNIPFPYLFDEDQSVAKAYHAACTPDFSVFDSSLSCIYRGRLDASSPGNNEPNNGVDLRAALDAGLKGAAPLQDQKPSKGCNIKWK